MSDKKTARIRALNDTFRQTGKGGRVVMTSGVDALGLAAQLDIQELVRRFDAFTIENDPYREHDFGAFEYQGERLFFKIDCYQKGTDYREGAENPSNPETTDRVMTIMLSSEY
jgi:hypothetical protein